MADNRGNLRGSAAAASGGSAVSVRGGQDFLAVSKRLKAAGQGGLRKEFHAAIRTAAKPLIPKVRQAARRKLPKAGGLNERIAKKPYRVQTRTGANVAGVRIVGTKVDPRINQGRVAHPVFGHKPMVVQHVPEAVGYFDETLADSAPQIRDEVTRTMQAWTVRIIRDRI